MKRLGLLLLPLAFLRDAPAQEINIGPCNDTVGVGIGISLHPCTAGGINPFVPSCAQSNAFLARVSNFSVSDKKRYDIFICGLEVNSLGCSNSLDALYLLAAPNQAASLLNVCGTSGTLTTNGTITFTANAGWQGGGGYLSNNLFPNSDYTRYTQNSASVGGCIVNSRTIANDGILLGVNGGGNETLIFPFFTSSGVRWNLNHATGLGTATTQANAQGLYHLTRVDSSNISFYKSGNTIALNSPLTADGVPTLPFYFGATNNNGSPANTSTDQIALIFIGRGMSGAEVTTFRTLWSYFADPISLTGC